MLIIYQAWIQAGPRPARSQRHPLPATIAELGVLTLAIIRLSGDLLGLWLMVTGILSIAAAAMRAGYGGLKILAGLGVLRMADGPA